MSKRQSLRAYFIGFTSNKPNTFGKPQEIENGGLRFLGSQERVIKFSKLWRVKEKVKECWHRGTWIEKLEHKKKETRWPGKRWGFRKLGKG